MTMVLKGKHRSTREANLLLAEGLDDGKWSKATPWHWRRALKDGSFIDFWPTTMKAQFSWFKSKDGCHEYELVDNAYQRIDELLKQEEAA